MPILRSIRLIILGTITAGDTAATTAPITAASRSVTPKSIGARIITPTISNDAGRKHINAAGRPTALSSLTLSERPARRSIITKAICRSSMDISAIELSIRSKPCTPNKIPATNIPTRGGSLRSVERYPNTRARINIKAKLLNIGSIWGDYRHLPHFLCRGGYPTAKF